jgi:hypothetical protein
VKSKRVVKETVSTVFMKRRKTVETVFYKYLWPGTGLKPGVNKKNFCAKVNEKNF